jgi:bifunctional DNA-binding transcriptional regulator/antitoxin component of YhaV-PrlF toxin-antitoxin module
MNTRDAVRSRVGKRGTLVLSAELRRHYGLQEGDDVIQEARPEGVLIRPAATVAVRLYPDTEKARLLLEGATTATEYERARKRVRELGVDPARVPHTPPA